MRTNPVKRRRFVVWMLVLFIPVAVALLYVITMQQYGLRHAAHSYDGSTVMTSDDVSYWGGATRSVVRAWDVVSGKMKCHWTVSKGRMWNMHVSQGGEQFLYHFSDGNVYVGRLENTPEPRVRSYELPNYGGSGDVLFTPDGDRLTYDGKDRTPRWLRLKTEESEAFHWKRPPRTGMNYWIDPGTLVWYSVKANERSGEYRPFRMFGNELVPIGNAISWSGSGVDFFDQSNRAIRQSPGESGCEVIDVPTGKTLHRLEAPKDCQATHWLPNGALIACLMDLDYDEDNAAYVNRGAVIFDANTGRQVAEVDFDITCRNLYLKSKLGCFLVATLDNGFDRIDMDGTVTGFAPSITYWWLPARIAVFSIAIFWWLTWSLMQRRTIRSHQPLIDLAILHLTLFVCTGLRLRAFFNGGSWSGYLHVWESVAFIGIGLSIVTWFLFWIVFGSHKWPIRFGTLVFGVAIVIGVIVLIWDAATEANGYDTSLALGQTMAGTLSQLIVQIVLCGVMYFLGLRLVNASDSPSSPDDRSVKPRTSIRDMFVWMVSFGVLFAILKLRNTAIPDQDNMVELLMTGTIAGCVGVATVWVVVGTSLMRFPAVVVTYAGMYLFCKSIGRMEIVHVGCAWIPMLLLSALVLRWNGYTLSWPRQYRHPDPEPSLLGGDEWRW